MKRSLFTSLVCLALLGAAAPAAADPDPYGQLVEEALREYDGGRFEEALALFEQAFAKRPSARAKRGMAKALFELRSYVRCAMAIDEALAGTVDPLPETLQGELSALRDRALRFVGRVALVVAPANAAVLVDGRLASSVAPDGTVLLDVGPHVVEVSSRGFQPARRSVDVRSGPVMRVAIELEPLPAAAPAAGAATTRVVPVTLLVTGGVLAVGGVVASSIWYSDRSSAVDRCVTAAERGARCENGDSVAFQRDASLTTIVLSSAAVVAAGAALYVTLRERPADRTRIGCAPGPGSLSCVLARTW